MRRLTTRSARHILASLALLSAAPLTAQTVSDDGAVPYTPLATGGPATAQDGPADTPPARADRRGRDRNRGAANRGPDRPRYALTPYIEVGQVVTGEFGNRGDVLTYTTLAVGVEADVSTRRAQGAADIRYERRIGESRTLLDSDIVSGLVRGNYVLTPGFSIEGGALASRASVDGRGGTADFTAGDQSNIATIYSVYAGPTFGRRIGDVDAGAAYRFGYSRSDIEFPAALASSATRVGSFEDSTNHAVIASIGMRPGRLPFGWLLSGNFTQESAGQLDQRYRAYNGRFDVTVPVSGELALLGGVGYENIELSQNAALLDGAGVPVLDANGRLISDTAQPRQIAFETDGLIYDAGVLWRPSRRVSVEARIGRRYDDTNYTGSASWQASSNTAVQLGVYDGLTSVGRQLTGSLAALPTDFDIYRNPVDNAIGGCAFGGGSSTGDGSAGTCLSSTLANASGFAFRNRGVVLSLSSRARPWTLGVALGYDRRRYLANGLIGIAGLDGSVDETWFAYASASRQLSRQTAFGGSLYATYFDGGLPGSANAFSAGASAALSHTFLPRLTGTAAATVNLIDQDGFNTRVFGSALLGLRYSFGPFGNTRGQ